MQKNKLTMTAHSLIKSVGEGLKFFPAFIFLVCFSTIANAMETYKIPDFAFPKTVEKESREGLEKAMEKENPVMVLREAMNLCVALNLTDGKESVMGNIALLDSVINKIPGEYRKLGCLLVATMLKDAYENNSTVYEGRNLPMDVDFPVDPMEWSAQMYKVKILEYTDSATIGLSSCTNRELKEISLLLDNWRDAEKIGLTVNDFIRFKSVDILKRFIRQDQFETIPFFPQQNSNGSSIDFVIKSTTFNLIDTLIEENETVNSNVCALAVINKASLLGETSLLIDKSKSSETIQEKYLKQGLKRLEGQPGSGFLLYELWHRYAYGNEKELYAAISNYLMKYPESVPASCLKYAKEMMSFKRLEVTVPRIVLPGMPFKADISLANINKGYLLIYSLTKDEYDVSDNFIVKNFNGNKRPVSVIEIEGNGVVPFRDEKCIEIPSLANGLYVVIPSTSKTLTKDWKTVADRYYPTFRITDISLVSSFDGNSKDSGRIYVVDSHNQQPIEGAEVTYYTFNSKTPKGKLITGKDGYVEIPTGYYRIEASKGKSFAKGEYGFSYSPEKKNVTSHVSILTDLSIYRPGDEVNFAVVGWLQDSVANHLIKDTPVDIILKDANYKNVETLRLQLNKEGRATGSFVLPEGKLSGIFRLVAQFPGSVDNNAGVTELEVAEYKLPGFFVNIQQEKNDSINDLKFTGVASTYSGMPITDASVRINVEYFSRFPWRFGTPGATYHGAYETDAKGKFQVILPIDSLKDTIFERGRYKITAEVTASTGETQSSGPLYFYLGKSYSVSPDLKDKMEITGDSVRLYVPVYDMAGLPTKIKTEYRISNIYDTVAPLTGVFISPSLVLPADRLPSGKYRLEFKTGDEEWTSTETVFWRLNEITAPYPTALWVPEMQYTYIKQQKEVEIKFGSYWQDWILFMLSDETGLIERKWIMPQDGLIRLPISLPDNGRHYFINLSSMHNLQAESARISIVPVSSLEKMEIAVESFRNNISAGQQEDWQFKFKIDGRTTESVNAFAVMSDKALNSLKDFKWSFNVWQPDFYSKSHISVPHNRQLTGYRSFSRSPKYQGYFNYIPEWQTYGYPLTSSGMRINDLRMYKMAATRNVMAPQTTGDVVTEAAVAFDDVALEGAMEESGIETSTIDQNTENQAKLRPVEMPVALFMPNLKSDENGNVDIKFTVPDFNTTWQFQLAGYNDSLLTAVVVLDAVASKAVMAKSNLPLYLLTGDKAELSAFLFNNSPESRNIEGRIEIIYFATNDFLFQKTFGAMEVPPSGNRVVSLKFDVPDNTGMIAVRTYAISDGISDGEQGFIKIYPSSSPVTEATTFYSKSDESRIEFKIPKLPKTANVTFKYCDNPIWEVLLSLPALDNKEPGNSLSMVRNLYAVLIANNIISTNPEIKRRLGQILSSQDSMIRQSNLLKDESVKIAALEMTPWVNNAERETLRIESLALYLDPEKVDNKINQLVEGLVKLQKSDGGWSWWEGMTSSPYITSQIIEIMAKVKRQGLLDENLLGMTVRAIKYYDKILEDWKSKNIVIGTQ